MALESQGYVEGGATVLTKGQKRREKIKKTSGMDRILPDLELISYENDDYQSRLIQALNYSNYMFDGSDYKNFAKDFYPDLDVDSVPVDYLENIGSMAWLSLNGANLSPVHLHTNREKLIKIIKELEDSKVDKVKIETPKINMEAATSNVIARLEGVFDDEPVKYKNIVDGIITTYPHDPSVVREYFQRQLDCFNDKEMKEYFPPNYKTVKAILEDIISCCEVKKVSTTRKPRKVNPFIATKSLKYMKEFKDFGIKSVVPSKIIGARLLWVYNTKTRKFIKYVASVESGFQVKGTSIYNFDPEKSYQKNLRKPKEFIDLFEKSGKVEQRRMFDDLNAVALPVSARMNAHCIILRIG